MADYADAKARIYAGSRTRVLNADDPEVRRSRLLLCDLTARTLALGLGLLGIEAPERM